MMLKLNIEVNDSIATINFEKKKPICANDVALAIVELERFKLNLIELYDDFDRLMVVNEKD